MVFHVLCPVAVPVDPPGVDTVEFPRADSILADFIITGDRLCISDEVLGTGHSGIVFRGTLDRGTPCAVKVCTRGPWVHPAVAEAGGGHCFSSSF
jgi:hypothetical protein